MKRILVVDDERRGRRILQIMIEQLGFESEAAESAEEALTRFASERIDLVLTDLRLPGMSGVDLLRTLRETDSDVPVVILTAYGTVQSAVEAMKLGAFDYILRPFDVDVVENAIRRALELRDVRIENRYLREQVRERSSVGKLQFASSSMREIADLIEKVGPTRSAVLITGETGTGKEVVARALHDCSPRSAKLFVPLNMAAIPADLLESELFGHARGAFTGADRDRSGKFEIADGGTIFLDEIGDMPYGLQAKLLRVLQEGMIEPVGSNRRIKVDVRVVSSTNRDLAAEIEAGRFRQDLFYRLNVFRIDLPALRQRPEDVALLATSFLETFARELGRRPPRLDDGAVAVLQRHDWPGNVRELRNIMERVAVLCTREGEIDGDFLAPILPSAAAAAEPEEDLRLETAIEKTERRILLRALAITKDNKAQAAKLLGISERTLWYKLSKYGL